jgi:hypothetical protein
MPLTLKIANNQQDIPIDEPIWQRAFAYAARELEIEGFATEVWCVFIRFDVPKIQPIAVGYTDQTEDGRYFFCVRAVGKDAALDALGVQFGCPRQGDLGQMIKTFFHELVHVKQLLKGELVIRSRYTLWKDQKWRKREYSFAPWEQQAAEGENRLYQGFLKYEVKKRMREPGANAYTVAEELRIFPKDDIFRVTAEIA